MDPIAQFFAERNDAILAMAKDKDLAKKSLDWMIHADKYKYTYNFTWMGRPIIKYPNDILIQQEIMWDIRPDLIIETGIAHGGSLVLSASLQKMMGVKGEVVGFDIDIREHNKKAIEAHPAFILSLCTRRILIRTILDLLAPHLVGKQKIMVILDSLHTHKHVSEEIALLSPLVSIGSYLVLPDTFIEFFPPGYYSVRTWDVGDNPFTAMQQFMYTTNDFVVDELCSAKAQITEAFSGYLKRVN